ncbi:hypothetical protein [Roseobacter sp.]|uniref:hypothetical protein n=1 Tax=Roseobacter sp. TaxID=1907202 RepID=UPI0025DF3FDE|nr:hypothetical protein [Roseobacter sp.]
MEAIFSKEIQDGLNEARLAALRKSTRLRVDVAGELTPVLRMWKSGFTTQAGGPSLRGFVDLYDGSVHLFQCLIVAAEEEAGEMQYEFKRATAVTGKAALDFELPDDTPVGLIADGRQAEPTAGR